MVASVMDGRETHDSKLVLTAPNIISWRINVEAEKLIRNI